MENVSYVIGEKFISLVIDQIPFNVKNTHRNFDIIKQRIKDNDYSDILDLVNESKSIEKKFEKEEITELTIDGSIIYYKGKVVDSSIVNQIITTKNQGYRFDNLLKFLENLLENTSYSIVKELYDWINSGDTVSITSDGAFLAYKKVRKDYKDIYSGKMDNSVGQTVEMERNEVDDNRNNTCSSGLHFCSYEYLNSYGTNDNDNRVVIVKIFPQHVVSIPTDYNFQKGRCSKYEVVGEVENWKDDKYLTKAVDDYDYGDHEEEEMFIESDGDFDDIYTGYEDNEDIIDLTEDMKVEDVDLGTKLVTGDGITVAIEDNELYDFDDLAEGLNTPKMTKIYNAYHNKSVKKLKTLSDARKAMRKIYDDSYDKFVELVEEYS